MNTRESGGLYRSGRGFGLRRTARQVRLSVSGVPLAQRRWLLPGALAVLVVGVLAGTALATLGLPWRGHATLTPARAVDTSPPGTPLPGLVNGPSPLPGQSGSDASPSPSTAGLAAPATPSVGMLVTDSSRCLDIDGSGNGAWTLAADCVGSDQQRWQLSRGISDQYVITNVATGKCLAVENGSRDDGARILQSDCRDGAEQRWLLRSPADAQTDAFTLANVNSGRCAAVEDDDKLRQHDCDGDDTQRWSSRS